MKFKITGISSELWDGVSPLKFKVVSLDDTPSSKLIKELEFSVSQVRSILLFNAKIPTGNSTITVVELKKLENVEVEVELEQTKGTRSSLGVVGKVVQSSGVEVGKASNEWPLPEKVSPFMPISFPYLPSKNNFRLGYAVVDAPAPVITSSRNTYIQETSALRSDSSIKTNHGMSYETYELSYIATGRAEVYTSVKEVFEQLAINPFICGDGGPFGSPTEEPVIPTKSIAVRSYGITTVPGYPDSIRVNINFEPYLWDYFRPAGEDPTEGKGANPNSTSPTLEIAELDQSICYPLYEMWCKQAEQSIYDPNPSLPVSTGDFVLAYPNPKSVKQVENMATEELLQTNGTYIWRDLESLVKKNYGDLIGSSAKKIQTANEGYYLVKASTPEQFKVLTGLVFDGVSWNDKVNASVAGLVEWSKYSTTLAGQDGNKITADSVLTPKGNPLFRNSLSSLKDPSNVFTPNVLLTDGLEAGLRAYFRTLGIERYRRSAEGAALEELVNAFVEREILLNLNDPYQRFAVVLKEDHQEIPTVIYKLKNLSANLGDQTSLSKKINSVLLSGGMEEVFRIGGNGSNDSNYVILGISASRIHSLALLSSQVHSLPFHQFMGTEGTRFTVAGKCFGIQAKNKLQQIKEDFDTRVLKAKSVEYSTAFNNTTSAGWSDFEETPFLIVQNDLFQLMGINYVIPTNLNWKTVEGKPNEFEFTIDFLDFSPKAKTEEQIKFLPTWNQTHKNLLSYEYYPTAEGEDVPESVHPTVLKALDWFTLQGALERYEVYPDLYLPTTESVNFWISESNRFAKLLIENKPTDDIDPFVREIVDKYIAPVEPLFNYNRNLMANSSWWSNFDGTGYVDPDFFYWYCPNDSWGSLFDYIAEDTLGPRDDLSAGPGGKHEMRYFDMNFPHATFQSSQQAGARSVNAKEYTKEQLANIVNTADLTKSDQPLKEYNEVIQEAKYLGISQGWWVKPNGIQGDGQVFFNISAKDLSDVNSEIPIDNIEQRVDPSKPDESKKLKDSKLDFRKDYHKFWKIQERQRMLKDFINLGKANSTSLSNRFDGDPALWAKNGLSQGNFLIPVGDIADNLAGGINQFFTNTSPTIPLSPDNSVPSETIVFPYVDSNKGFLQDNSGINWIDYRNRHISYYLDQEGNKHFVNGLDFWEFYVKSRVKENKVLQPNPTGLFIKGLLDPSFNKETASLLQDLPVDNLISGKPSWLQRVALINNFYQIPRLENKSYQKQEDIHKTVIYNYALIASKCKPYNIDPNLVIAYFIRRTGMGHSPPTLDPNEKGFGGWDSRVTSAVEPEECIDLFIKTFADYKKKYFYTSIALLLTDYKYSGATLSSLNNIDYESILKDVANKNVEEFERELAKAFKNGLPSQVLDGTYMCWVEVSRVLGYVDTGPNIDNYFNYNNPLLVIDIGTNKWERVLLTDYAPSRVGSTVAIRMARDRILPPYGLKVNDLGYTLDPESALDKIQYIRPALKPDTEDAIYGMLLNMRKYSPYGRIVGSYPSYVAIFINEGYFYKEGSNKLWDTYYTRGGIQAIEISKSRHDPASYANITLSNVYHQLSRYTALEAYLQQLTLEDKERIGIKLRQPGQLLPGGRIWDDIVTTEFFKKPTGELLDIYARSYINMFNLSSGARLHLRLGYGSNPAKLPVVFNGTVVNVALNNDVAVLEAVGDGAELAKQTTRNLSKTSNGWAFNDGGILFGSGKSPSSIVIESLVNIEFWSNFLAGFVNNNFFRDFSHGIAHFGDVYHDDQAWYPAELHINIYDSSLTAMEQDVDPIKNMFEHSAFWDWGHNPKNYFSVSVQEPSAWKIAKVCSHAVFDFVTSAEPIMTHSTLFFGKWWWMMNYGYKEEILDYVTQTEVNYLQKDVQSVPAIIADNIKTLRSLSKKDSLYWDVKETELVEETFKSSELIKKVYDNLITQRSPRDYLFKKDIETKLEAILSYYTNVKKTDFSTAFRDLDFLVGKMYKKPFTQIVAITSNLNLLATHIELQGDLVHTDAVGVYTYNGMLTGDDVTKTGVYSVDTSIVGTDRKTLLVDTSIKNTALQRGWKGIATLAERIPRMLGANFTGTDQYPSTPGIHNSVVAGLVDSVKEMYGGTIITTGMAYLKPHDVIGFSDEKTGLQGILGVKEVVHRIDGQSGFITLITPDCVALPRSAFQGERLLAVGVLPVAKKVALFWGLKATAVTLKHAVGRVFKNSDSLKKLGEILENNANYEIAKGIKAEGTKIVDLSREDLEAKLAEAVEGTVNKDAELEKLSEIKDEKERQSKAKRLQRLKKRDQLKIKYYETLLEVKKVEQEVSVLDKELIQAVEDIELFEVAEKEVYDAVREQNKIEQVLNQDDLEKRILADLDIRKSKKIQNTLDGNKLKKAIDLRNQAYDRLEKAIVELEKLEKSLGVGKLSKAEKQVFEKILLRLKKPTDLSRRYRAWVKVLAESKEFLLALNANQRTLAEKVLESTIGPYLRLNKNLDRTVEAAGAAIGRDLAALKQDGLEAVLKDKWKKTLIVSSWVKIQETIAGIKEEVGRVEAEATIEGADAVKAAKNANKAEVIAEKTTSLFKSTKATQTTEAFIKSNLFKFKKVSAQIRTGSLATPIGIAKELIFFGMGNGIIDNLNNWLIAQKCVKIYPLFSSGVPYVAGIRGHQGSVVGDDPSWWDRTLSAVLTGDPEALKKAGLPPQMSGVAMMLSFIGTTVQPEIPDWYPSPGDQQYLQEVNANKSRELNGF